MQGDAGDDGGHYFFFSAPASPVHYILRSPPSSTAAAAASSFHFAALADADCCASAAAVAAEDFEFAAHGAGTHGGPGTKGGVTMMSSAEELFVAGRIRVGCLSPIRQEDGDGWEDCGGGGGDDDDQEEERDGHDRSPRAATRRARSASPTRSPRADRAAAFAEPSGPFASASSSSSSSASSSSSSSSAKNIRRRLSLRDLLSRTGADWVGADQQASSGTDNVTSSRLGFWPPSLWPSRSFKKPPQPRPSAPQPGRRSTSSDRPGAVPTAAAKRQAPGGSSARRTTTSLPYRQGLVLGCLGFGARGYGLAKSMHPLPSR